MATRRAGVGGPHFRVIGQWAELSDTLERLHFGDDRPDRGRKSNLIRPNTRRFGLKDRFGSEVENNYTGPSLLISCVLAVTVCVSV